MNYPPSFMAAQNYIIVYRVSQAGTGVNSLGGKLIILLIKARQQNKRHGKSMPRQIFTAGMAMLR